MSKEVFTIFDFETTGLNNPVGTDQVIEVAALRTDLEKDYGSIHMYVSLENGRTLPEHIKKLTGITEEQIKRGVNESIALHSLMRFLEDTTAVAHHYPFDSSFIYNVLGITPTKFICTRVLAKLLEPDKPASLKDVAARIGHNLTGHHQAGNDIIATKAVLKHYLPIADASGIKYRNTLINDEERPLNFVPKFANVVNKKGYSDFRVEN